MNISKRFDFEWFSILAVLFLITSSLITIYSLSLSDKDFSYFYKQIIFFSVALPFFIFFSFYDYRNWKIYGGILYLIGIVLLISVLFLGKNIRGTTAWFDLGFFNFQPVEIVKVFVIIALAKYFSKNIKNTIGFKEVAISFLYIIIPVFLTIRQPDFGSAMVILAIWFGLLTMTNVRKKIIVFLILIFLPISFFGWNFFLKDYQKERIQVFFNPEKDALGSGYNVLQSMIAVGSGGSKGKGLGYGSQSQLNFLPEKHNDFIFAVIAEENGFLGAFVIIFIYGFLFYRLKIIAHKSKDYFGWLIISGIIVMLFFQIAVNIGMNVGLFPIAGISLPFLSYGGSFILASMISIGVAQNIWKNRKKDHFYANEEDN